MPVITTTRSLSNSARVRAARQAWLMERIFGSSAGASLQPSPQLSRAEVAAVLRGRVNVLLVESAAESPATTAGRSLSVRELVDALRGLATSDLHAPAMRDALADLLRRFEDGKQQGKHRLLESATTTLPPCSPRLVRAIAKLVSARPPQTRLDVRAMLRGR